MDSDFRRSQDHELPSQPFEQAPTSAETRNDGCAVTSDELVTYLVYTSTDASSHDPSQPKESYQCRRCGKHFGRLDHVKRHCRSHANERTYLCKLCSKGFNRKDLLDRHIAIHRTVEHLNEYRVKRRTRAAKACAQCTISKTKCSDERPCQRCRDRGQPCGPEPEDSRPLLPGSSTQSDPALRDQDAALRPFGAWVPEDQDNDNVPMLLASSHNQARSDEMNSVQATNLSEMPLTSTERNVNSHGSNILNASMFPSIWDNNFFSTETAVDIDDDILMDMDLNWNSFVQLDYDFNPEGPRGSAPRRPREGDSLTSGSRPRGPSVREFFSQSLWLWEPDVRDSASTEGTPHLSEADERVILSSGPIDNAPGAKAPEPSLSVGFTCRSATRDALLLMVQCHSDSTAAVRCFPSAQVLSFLLKAFAFQETVCRCPVLHLPSFKSDRCRIELLSALIVAGSTNLSNLQIWQLGLALQDRTRIAIYKALDHKVTNWRDIDLLQAQILWVEAGLWSGVRWKMEVAESAANSIPIMIRRAGAYNLLHLESTWSPSSQDDSDALQSKWIKWVEVESFRRCVLRAFINDIQASVAYTRSPRFYSTEFTFGLPAAHDLWMAPDHLAWRTAILSKTAAPNQLKLALRDIIQDSSTLHSLPQEYDGELSAFAALHCLWPQIVALQDAKTLHQGHGYNKSPSQSSLWLEGQRQDLYKRLAEIRETSNAIGILTCEAQMVCELFMMALFVSFVDIEKLVGRFGLEESQLTTPSLQTWSDSDERWHAMWHAGQVLKAAQNMKPTQLRSFYAVAVYQACVVLALPFLLGAINKNSRRETPEPLTDTEPNLHQPQQQRRTLEETIGSTDGINLVVLNGGENMQVRSYLLNGQGTTGLLLGNELTALCTIEVIPTVISKILESNYGAGTDRLPPMSEKLVALVKELTKFTGS